MAPYLAESLSSAEILPSANIIAENEGRSRRLSSREMPLISSKLVRRKRLQHFLAQIKLLVRQSYGRGRGIRRLSTLEALDKALQMLHHSQCQKAVAPSPPANSSSSSIPSPAREQSPPIKTANQQSTAIVAPPPSDLQLLKSCGSPQSGGSADFQTVATVQQQNQPMLGRRFLGQLFVSLPEGIVLECQDASPNRRGCNNELTLSGVLQPGDSLLALLHGKGAQTMLLNAFCGHSRRRMYARMKWGSESTVRACELLCEFSVDPESVARRLANIQLFCVQSGALLRPIPITNSSNEIKDADIAQQQPQQQLTFTTRHNSGCALIYLDSNSIPLLGHFPSEVTGKSLFSLVHPEDASKIRDVHQQLHSGAGIQIVRTPGLHLLAYSGKSIAVDSEWAAFVNPWTRHIEMVVGRHIFTAAVSSGDGQLTKENNDVENSFLPHQQFGEQQATTFVHALLSEPVPEIHSQHQQLLEYGQNGNNELMQISADQHNIGQKDKIIGQTNQQLSYNQINCLENVHRLLKSQSQLREENNNEFGVQRESAEDTFVDQISHHPQSGSPSLTRELLQQHDQRWEEECRDHWRRRLSAKTENGLKRSVSGGQFDRVESSSSPAKQFRSGSDGGMAGSTNQNNRENPICGPLKHPPPSFFPPFPAGADQSNVASMFPLLGGDIGNQQIGLSNENLLCALTSNAAIHHHPHLLEQLLQAANAAKNTLALKLFQQQQQETPHQHHQFSN